MNKYCDKFLDTTLANAVLSTLEVLDKKRGRNRKYGSFKDIFFSKVEGKTLSEISKENNDVSKTRILGLLRKCRQNLLKNKIINEYRYTLD